MEQQVENYLLMDRQVKDLLLETPEQMLLLKDVATMVANI